MTATLSMPLWMVVVAGCVLAAAAVAAWVMACRTWENEAIYRARQRLFGIRDELFLLFLRHGMVDHPAHRRLREVLNAHIRHAHRVSMMWLLAVVRTYLATDRGRGLVIEPTGKVELDDAVRRSLDEAARVVLELAFERSVWRALTGPASRLLFLGMLRSMIRRSEDVAAVICEEDRFERLRAA